MSKLSRSRETTACTHRFLACIVYVTLAELTFAGDSDPQNKRVSDLPNVVIIFADDLGYGDVGVFGAKGFKTPNIDQLAREGRKFTNFYVAEPVCSASRTGLLTGCYPVRLGIRGALGPRNNHGIHPDETTLAEVLKSRGYVTAIFGKWHLGHHKPFLPLQHGFDFYYGLPYSNDMWPHHPDYVNLPPGKRKAGFPKLPLFEGNEIIDHDVTSEDQTQLTTNITEHAVDFIEKHRNTPFFLYVPHPMPHVPLHVSKKHEGSSEQGLYGDVIQEIDWSVGEITKTLKKHGLDDKTLVIFTSDNGPWISYGDHAGSAGGLREAKGTTFEGGVRVPCIMSWPGTIPSDTVCDEPMMTIDILPTIAAVVKAKLPSLPIDGLNCWPLIEGKEGARCPHQAYFFYYHNADLEAVRSGNWKLHFPHAYRTLSGRPGGTGGIPVKYDQARTELELYDLAADPGETKNVAEQHPAAVERITKLADEMRNTLGDQLTKTKGNANREPAQFDPASP